MSSTGSQPQRARFRTRRRGSRFDRAWRRYLRVLLSDGRGAEVLAHEITHAIQWQILGTNAIEHRHNYEVRTWGESGQYMMMSELFETPLDQVSPVDISWTLEQIADRVGLEMFDIGPW